MNLPQIKITCKDITLDLTSYEALIFSSKNGVKAIENINRNWRKISSYAIGKPTAQKIKELGGNLVYTSTSSYGNSFAQELLPKLIGKKVLFLRAKKVLSSLEEILKKHGIDVDSQIVYETVCTKKRVLHVENEKSVFIFTSPSTAECFFRNNDWCKNYIAVCIGEVTARVMPSDISLHVSKTQTIQACIELAKTLIKQN